jgi:hypothetical protein
MNKLPWVVLVIALAFYAILVAPHFSRGFGEGPFMPISIMPRDAQCKTVAINLFGTANADITIDSTAGGIVVSALNTLRCGMAISNSGGADMRCAPVGVVPTSTVGILVPAGQVRYFGLEGQQLWKCIRTTGSSTTANVWEAVP